MFMVGFAPIARSSPRDKKEIQLTGWSVRDLDYLLEKANGIVSSQLLASIYLSKRCGYSCTTKEWVELKFPAPAKF